MTEQNRSARNSVKLHVSSCRGETFYLGLYGSPESRLRYQDLIREYLENQEQLPIHLLKSNHISISELSKRYLLYAKEYYQKNGRSTGSYDRYKISLDPLIQLFGSCRINDFGPLALQQVRDWLIAAELARQTVNTRIDCIRNVFRWAVANELCEESVHSALMKVKRLEKGRTKAPDWSGNYAEGELRAEIGAAMLAAELQLPNGILESNASYVESWLRHLQRDNRYIFKQSAAASRAVDYLLNLSKKNTNQGINITTH